MKVLPPIWCYECASGPRENPARYQTRLIRRGWGTLTEEILHAYAWGVREFAFHLPHGKIPSGTMDFDALLHARDRGAKAYHLATTFERYTHALLHRLDDAVVVVYLGSLLCESLESLLADGDVWQWTRRVMQVLKPLLDNDRIDIAIDMSAGMDEREHPGLFVLEMIERIKASQGRLVYVEGVPTPRPDRDEMLRRPVVCTEKNWTRAMIDHPADGRDPSLLQGPVVRWFNGHFFTRPESTFRHNAFGEDPMRFFGDTVRRGHRVMTTLGGLRSHLMSSSIIEYEQVGQKAAALAGEDMTDAG